MSDLKRFYKIKSELGINELREVFEHSLNLHHLVLTSYVS